MPSNNSKYSDEMREQTAKYVLESGKSATSVADEQEKVEILKKSLHIFMQPRE